MMTRTYNCGFISKFILVLCRHIHSTAVFRSAKLCMAYFGVGMMVGNVLVKVMCFPLRAAVAAAAPTLTPLRLFLMLIVITTENYKTE